MKQYKDMDKKELLKEHENLMFYLNKVRNRECDLRMKSAKIFKTTPNEAFQSYKSKQLKQLIQV